MFSCTQYLALKSKLPSILSLVNCSSASRWKRYSMSTHEVEPRVVVSDLVVEDFEHAFYHVVARHDFDLTAMRARYGTVFQAPGYGRTPIPGT